MKTNKRFYGCCLVPAIALMLVLAGCTSDSKEIERLEKENAYMENEIERLNTLNEELREELTQASDGIEESEEDTEGDE